MLHRIAAPLLIAAGFIFGSPAAGLTSLDRLTPEHLKDRAVIGGVRADFGVEVAEAEGGRLKYTVSVKTTAPLEHLKMIVSAEVEARDGEGELLASVRWEERRAAGPDAWSYSFTLARPMREKSKLTIHFGLEDSDGMRLIGGSMFELTAGEFGVTAAAGNR